MPSQEPLAEVQTQAVTLIKTLARRCNSQAGCGSFSSVPYDSAWVSMIKKSEKDGGKRWRFLECFQFILDAQRSDGGWRSDVNSKIDAILNTMASLLALKLHAVEPLNSTIPADMDDRMLKANVFLQAQLKIWDVEASDHVGFEILVPSLLELLAEAGFQFKIRDQLQLNALNKMKMEHFQPEILYKKKQYTILHSLEALVGKIDFDRMVHHKISGSMMGSPSSTAAYLMYSTNWDEDSERYLESVISAGSGNGNGGVPSAFPTPVFELSWTLSTLLVSGFTVENLGFETVQSISGFLRRSFEVGNGLLGFAPNLLPDADDTAKTIISLGLIGEAVSPERLIAEFETESHFRTYSMERNASFSANCNVLCALLYMEHPATYLQQIVKATVYLCRSWWEGSCKDKWNIAPQYPMMLLAQVLMRLLRLHDSRCLKDLPAEIKNHIPIVLFQILNRTLRSQDSNGSWSQSRDISAYAVLTLVYLHALPWANSLEPEIDIAIASGRKFLLETPTGQHDNIWIEKVSYGSAVLCQAYCLSALNASVENSPWKEIIHSLANVPMKSVNRLSHFFSKLPIFAKESKWKLQASLIEGFLFLPMLRSVSHDIFPKCDAVDERYLEYIPLTWTTSNNLYGYRLSAKLLKEMMVISMLNYQADEFMEAVIGKEFEYNLTAIKATINFLCQPSAPKSNGFANGRSNGSKTATNRQKQGPQLAQEAVFTKENLVPARDTLQRFTKYVLTHPKVVMSSESDQFRLRRELETFLLAHITHIEDNSRFAGQKATSDSAVRFLSPRSTYYSWVHTTSANHTSCPYSFAFVSCLTSTGASDCFGTSFEKYLAEDACSHLAVMCRQYNDYGSIMRDRTEKNLNSINFPEFHPAKDGGFSDHTRTDDGLKVALFEVAEFERECLASTMKKLLRRVPTQVADMLKVFVGVTDLYGQIYVARDIGIASRSG